MKLPFLATAYFGLLVLRASCATYSTFDVPGAGTGNGQGTVASAINKSYTVSGIYWDANSVSHGFVRTAVGTIFSFDAPGAGTGAFQGTRTGGMNEAGTIVGYSIDPTGTEHGFVRTADGRGTNALNINEAGTVVGTYYDAKGGSHGFVRAADGTFTTFDVPKAEATTAISINAHGLSPDITRTVATWHTALCGPQMVELRRLMFPAQR